MGSGKAVPGKQRASRVCETAAVNEGNNLGYLFPLCKLLSQHTRFFFVTVSKLLP